MGPLKERARCTFSATCEENPNGMVPFPGDCTKFYQCANGVAHETTCGANTFFNPGSSACDWWANLSAERQEECADQAPDEEEKTARNKV